MRIYKIYFYLVTVKIIHYIVLYYYMIYYIIYIHIDVSNLTFEGPLKKKYFNNLKVKIMV